MADPAIIRPATTAADIAAVVELCWAYRDFLLNVSGTHREIVEAFYPHDKYQTLMEGLESEHARPQGIILIAELDGVAVGCGMTHSIYAQTAEIKRVFVNEDARGQRIADRLCRALMDQARRDGYTRMVLDTSKTLTSAQRLYERMGFARRDPYQPIPDHVLPHLVFYETPL